MPRIEKPKGEIIIYKSSEGPQVRVSLADETVWLTQAQMAELFSKDLHTVNEHIKNIYKEAELNQNQTIRKFRIVQTEGNKQVTRDVNYYNLDMIISVGYRVNSKRGTQFRIWATRQLRNYVFKGYALNERRLKENQDIKLRELETAHRLIQQALESKRSEGYERELLRIITDYAETWFVLLCYDEKKLEIEDVSTRRSTPLDYEETKKNIKQFKNRLLTNFCYLGIFGRMYWKKTKITARTTTIRNNKSRVFPIVNYFYLNRVYSEIFALKNFSSANFKPAKIATPKKVAKTATR